MYKKTCAYCGTEFTTEYEAKKYCTEDCKTKNKRAQAKESAKQKPALLAQHRIYEKGNKTAIVITIMIPKTLPTSLWVSYAADMFKATAIHAGFPFNKPVPWEEDEICFHPCARLVSFDAKKRRVVYTIEKRNKTYFSKDCV